MDRRVASGRPAGPHLQQRGVVGVPDVKAAAGNARALDLRMAPQAKVGVAGYEHFPVDGAMGIVTNGAAFAQRRVLEDEGPGLLAMALRAAFVLPGHGQSAPGFENVTPVRVVALDTGQAAFDDLVMLREAELRLDIQMTLKTG